MTYPTDSEKLATRDIQITKLNSRILGLQRKIERKDLSIQLLCRELNEALEMIYGIKKEPDLTAERILQDTLSDMGMHNEKVGE